MSFDPDELRRYMGRDWASANRPSARRSPAERLDAIAATARMIRAARPGWRGADARGEDFETHVRVARMLRALDGALGDE